MWQRITRFIRTDVWRLDTREMSRLRGFAVHHFRVLLVALHGFQKDECALRASSLTYYTLLSIVPVLAMAFGIAKGFGLEEMLHAQLEYYLGAHEEILDQVIKYSYSMLEVTRGGLVAGIGFLFLVWAVFKVLDHIEQSLNAVWGVIEGRSWPRKITEYISLMVVGPILLILSGSLTVFITTELHKYLDHIGMFSLVVHAFEWGAQLMPYIMMWLLFTFLFIAMPNIRVGFKSALIAGVISGTLFQLLQWAYITFQVGAVRYNAIYGSFAALPLFLIWVQLSWMIVLLGAELSFAYQNVRRFIFASEIKNISPRYKRKVSLLVMHFIIKRFLEEKGGTTSEDICRDLGLPVRLVQEVLRELYQAELVVRVAAPGGEDQAYMPGKDVNLVSIAYVLRALDNTGSQEVPVSGEDTWARIQEIMEGFDQVLEKSPDNTLLKDLG